MPNVRCSARLETQKNLRQNFPDRMTMYSMTGAAPAIPGRTGNAAAGVEKTPRTPMPGRKRLGRERLPSAWPRWKYLSNYRIMAALRRWRDAPPSPPEYFDDIPAARIEARTVLCRFMLFSAVILFHPGSRWAP
jgi:hypothetical protein